METWIKIKYRANFDGEVLPLKQRELSSSLRRGTKNEPVVINKRMKDIAFYQQQYDSGKSLDTICREFPEAKRFFLQKNLKFRSRSQAASAPRKPLSDNHKKKLSEKQTQFLKNNPELVPYRKAHHSKGGSYPENVFAQALENAGIKGWVREFRNSLYSYDFAFLEKKIDVEIDGPTHTSVKVKQIDSRRDEWSKQQGWTVVRFTAKDVLKDVGKCIEHLQQILG
jgi:very-short-patch-repair endonuclease